MKVLKICGFLLLGGLITVGVISAVIGIAGAVNHITFGEQITQWFGSIGNVKETLPQVEEVVKTVLKI